MLDIITEEKEECRFEGILLLFWRKWNFICLSFCGKPRSEREGSPLPVLPVDHDTRWSISRVLFPVFSIQKRPFDGHSSGTLVTKRLAQPTRMTARERTWRSIKSVRHSYLVLLRVGFTMPPPLLEARCALTTPFHPYRLALWAYPP